MQFHNEIDSYYYYSSSRSGSSNSSSSSSSSRFYIAFFLNSIFYFVITGAKLNKQKYTIIFNNTFDNKIDSF